MPEVMISKSGKETSSFEGELKILSKYYIELCKSSHRTESNIQYFLKDIALPELTEEYQQGLIYLIRN